MALIVISNAFLLTVVIGYIVFRLLCEFGGETHLRPQKPSDIHFTSSVITSDLTSPAGARVPLTSLIDELSFHGDHLATFMEPIHVYYDKSEQKWRTMNNRRLYALRKAEQRGAVNTVRYEVIEAPISARSKGQCSMNICTVPQVKELPGFEWKESYNLL